MFHPDGPTFFELAEQALSSTARGYDLLAPKFDLTPFRTPDPIIEATLEAARIDRQRRGRGPIDRGLDLCCGTGAALGPLRRYCRLGVTGVDFSPGMLDVARRRLSATAGPPVELVEGDVLTLRLERRFDLVTCFGALGHIPVEDEPQLLDVIRRHLRPGGAFAFASAHRPPWWRPGRWLAHGFNAAMRLRNALIRPPFVMYYLTFLLPDCLTRLEAAGFDVAVHEPRLEAPFGPMRIVVARRD